MNDSRLSIFCVLRRIAAVIVGAVGIVVVAFCLIGARFENELIGDHFWEISPSQEQSLKWGPWAPSPPIETPTARLEGLTEIREAQFTTLFNVYKIHQARNPTRPAAHFMCPLMNEKQPRVLMQVSVLGGVLVGAALAAWALWGKRRMA